MAVTGTTEYGNGLLVLTVDADPRVTAVDAPSGSVIIFVGTDTATIRNGDTFRKLDDGSTTNMSESSLKNSFAETTDPGVSDDNTQDYQIGSQWINVTLDKAFICLDAATGAAVWIQTTASGATDADAIHDNVAGEIAAIAEKTTLVDADLVLIEDSEDSNNKKRVQVVNLPGGGGSTLPVVDTTGIAKGSADATKVVRFEVDGLTTGTTRVLTVPDEDITLVGVTKVVLRDGTQTLTGPWAVGGFDLTGLADLVPDGDDTRELGSVTLGWKFITVGDIRANAASDTIRMITNTGSSYVEFTLSQVTFNEFGGDRNLRIEGNLDENLGFFDAGTDRFGVGVAVPLAKFHVAGGILGEYDVEAVAATPRAVLATEPRRVFTNEGAAVQIVHNLPPAVAGLTYSFVVQDPDGIRVNAVGDDTIRIAGTASAAAGRIEAATVGDTITLVAINAIEWIGLSREGTWTVDGTAVAGWLHSDGSIPLTSSWDTGAFDILTQGIQARSGQSLLLRSADNTIMMTIDNNGVGLVTASPSGGNVTIGKIAGGPVTSLATALESRKLGFQAELWDGAAPNVRTAFIRYENDAGQTDQGRFTFSTDEDGGVENNIFEIQREVTTGNVTLHDGDGGERFRFVKGQGVELRVGSFRITNDEGLEFGSGGKVRFEYGTTVQTNNTLLLGLENGTAAKTLVITTVTQLGLDHATGNAATPTVRFHDGSATASNFGSITHDGTDFLFTSNAGVVHLNSNVRVTGNILPEADGTRTIGSDGAAWGTLIVRKVRPDAGQVLALSRDDGAVVVTIKTNSDIEFSGNLLGDADGTRQLGESTRRWKMLHTFSPFLRRLVEENTAVAASPNALSQTETYTLLTNEGATAENHHDLPAAVAGLNYTFVVQDAFGIQINAATGDTLRIGGTVSAAAGRIEAATIGDVVTLVAINSTEWIGFSREGTWTVDGAAVAGWLHSDGSVPLTNDWNTGAFDILTQGIQGRSGQSLLLKDAGGTTRITVFSTGEITIAPTTALTVSGDILPEANNTRDLGSPSLAMAIVHTNILRPADSGATLGIQNSVGDDVVSITSSGTVFNEGGIDLDWRVEGAGDPNLLVADGGLDQVAIGVLIPVAKLTVEGTVKLRETNVAIADTAAYGQFWVRDDVPNTPMFTDDVGTDFVLNAGGDPTSEIAEASGDITTASGSDIVATSMTITPASGTYLVWFTGSVDHSVTNQTIDLSIFDGGTIQASSERRFKNGGAQGDVSSSFACSAKVTVNGSQAIEGRWRTSGTLATMHERTLKILKVA